MTEKILGAYGINYSYSKERVLTDISLELYRNQITALLGPNASGKSTLLKILAGILPIKITSGQIRYLSQNVYEMTAAERARSIVYVAPGMRAEFPLTAFETVALGRLCHYSHLSVYSAQKDRDQIHWAMEQCNCWGLRERYLHTLSGGERQLVVLARALTQGAKVLLLDEALSKMDLHHQAMTGKLLQKLTKLGYSIVLVSHDLNLASEWADNCLLLKNGQAVASGSVKEVLVLDRVKSLYPGAELSVSPSPSSGAPKIFFGCSK